MARQQTDGRQTSRAPRGSRDPSVIGGKKHHAKFLARSASVVDARGREKCASGRPVRTGHGELAADPEFVTKGQAPTCDKFCDQGTGTNLW